MRFNKIRWAAKAIFILMINNVYAEEYPTCPAPISCAPCGSDCMSNLPAPSYGDQNPACGVQPFQNFIATTIPCNRGGWNGFYFGSGFGYGHITYNFNIPGIVFPYTKAANSYIIEFVNIGYAYSNNSFFLAGEIAYYYNSVTEPFFYEDFSTFTVNVSEIPLLVPASTTIVTPCTVRLDVNAQNHVAFDLMPGLVLSPQLTIFSRIGLDYTKYTWIRRICFPQVEVLSEFGGVAVDVNDPLDVNNPLFSTQFSDVNDTEGAGVIGFRLGGGIAYSPIAHLTFNVSYVHIYGNKASFTPNASLIDPNGPLVTSGFFMPVGVEIANLNTLLAQNTIDPSRNEILIGFTVSF